MNLKSLLSRLTTLENEIIPTVGTGINAKNFSFAVVNTDGSVECGGQKYASLDEAKKTNSILDTFVFRIVEAAPE